MNTNFKIIGLTRLKIKPESAARKVDALTTRSSELLMDLNEKQSLKFQKSSILNYILYKKLSCEKVNQRIKVNNAIHLTRQDIMIRPEFKQREVLDYVDFRYAASDHRPVI